MQCNARSNNKHYYCKKESQMLQECQEFNIFYIVFFLHRRFALLLLLLKKFFHWLFVGLLFTVILFTDFDKFLFHFEHIFLSILRAFVFLGMIYGVCQSMYNESNALTQRTASIQHVVRIVIYTSGGAVAMMFPPVGRSSQYRFENDMKKNHM